jgi:sarcosine oxidase
VNQRFDCIVAGLGAAGSATLHHLALRGARVAGFDAHNPPHTHGSSHGETRMIREAYFEDPRYVPLVRHAYDLWHELAAESRTTLIEETRGVFAGRANGQLIPGIRRASTAHHISIREYTAAEQAHAFPWLHPDAAMLTVTEPRAGLLHPERCIRAHLDAAVARGAVVNAGQPVLSWKTDGGHVEVETARGRVAAGRLVLATGAWMTEPLADAGVSATVTRQPLFWFGADDPRAARTMPVWAVEFETGRLLYGFPDRGHGLKVAIHDPGTPTTPDSIDRTVHVREIDAICALLDRYLPGVFGGLLATATCMYTNTPDGHFVIDRHPDHEQVVVLAPCSGHGFKFASAVGEAAAQWSLDGAPRLDLSPFSLARFARR